MWRRFFSWTRNDAAALAPNGDDWLSAGQLPRDRLTEIGVVALDLMLDAPEWVHRRVETLTFVDAGVVHRHLSVDFTLPRELREIARLRDGTPLHLVPITVLPRFEGPMLYDVRDAAGKALPLLTESQNRRITSAALYEFARRVLGEHDLEDALKATLGNTLASIPTLEYPDALRLTRRILRPREARSMCGEPDWIEIERTACTQLAGHETFRDFLSLVTGNSLAVVPVSGPAGEERIVKLAYEEIITGASDAAAYHERPGLATRLRRWGRKQASFNPFTPETANVKFAALGAASTHHVQILIPQHLEITDVWLRAWIPFDAIKSHVVRGSRRRAIAQGEHVVPVHSKFVRGFATRAHLYLSDGHMLTSGSVRLRLRAERRGFLTWAPLAALVVAGLLFAYWRNIDTIAGSSNPGTAVLALAPGLLAAYLVRPGEHAVTRNVLRWPRVILGLAAVLVFVAAACIVLIDSHESTQVIKWRDDQLLVTPVDSQAPEQLRDALRWLFLVAVATVVLLGLFRFFPRPRSAPEQPQSRQRFRRNAETTSRASAGSFDSSLRSPGPR